MLDAESPLAATMSYVMDASMLVIWRAAVKTTVRDAPTPYAPFTSTELSDPHGVAAPPVRSPMRPCALRANTPMLLPITVTLLDDVTGKLDGTTLLMPASPAS